MRAAIPLTLIALSLVVVPPVDAQEAAQVEDAPPPELIALLPASGALDGLERDGDPVFYSRAALPDYIDGDAETYYTYGIGFTAAARYADGVGGRLELDVYDMLTPLGAFGVYAQRRPEDPDYVDLGAQGYVRGRQVVCFANRYYIVVRSVSRTEEGLNHAKVLARLVADAVPGEKSLPKELDYFPAEGRLVGTETYNPQSFLGLEGMPALFACRYAVPDGDEDTWQLAFGLLEDEESADGVFDVMAETLKTRAVGPGPLREGTVYADGIPVRVLAVELKYRGLVAAVRVGRVLIVLVGADETVATQACRQLILRMIERGAAPLS